MIYRLRAPVGVHVSTDDDRVRMDMSVLRRCQRAWLSCVPKVQLSRGGDFRGISIGPSGRFPCRGLQSPRKERARTSRVGRPYVLGTGPVCHRFGAGGCRAPSGLDERALLDPFWNSRGRLGNCLGRARDGDADMVMSVLTPSWCGRAASAAKKSTTVRSARRTALR